MHALVVSSIALIATTVALLVLYKSRPSPPSPVRPIAAAAASTAGGVDSSSSCTAPLARPAVDPSSATVDRPSPGETGFGSLINQRPPSTCVPSESLNEFFQAPRCDVPTDDYVVLQATGSPAIKPFSSGLPMKTVPMSCV